MAAGAGEPPLIVLPSGDTVRAVTGCEDVRLDLADPRFTRELHKIPGSPRMVRGADMSDDKYSIMNVDPPWATSSGGTAGSAVGRPSGGVVRSGQ